MPRKLIAVISAASAAILATMGGALEATPAEELDQAGSDMPVGPFTADRHGRTDLPLPLSPFTSLNLPNSTAKATGALNISMINFFIMIFPYLS